MGILFITTQDHFLWKLFPNFENWGLKHTSPLTPWPMTKSLVWALLFLLLLMLLFLLSLLAIRGSHCVVFCNLETKLPECNFKKVRECCWLVREKSGNSVFHFFVETLIQITWHHQMPKHKKENIFYWIIWEVNTACSWNLVSLYHITKEKKISKSSTKTPQKTSSWHLLCLQRIKHNHYWRMIF